MANLHTHSNIFPYISTKISRKWQHYNSEYQGVAAHELLSVFVPLTPLSNYKMVKSKLIFWIFVISPSIENLIEPNFWFETYMPYILEYKFLLAF